jgi:2-polyprenyl-6-methoxyphenol hydroxylase-like FAD-dependent oxidoreductase
MAYSRKALIIGAGIAGPTTAIFLKQAGIDAEVFEAWPYSSGIGGGLQIAPNGMHVLAEIGLADELIRRGSIAESFDFYSQSGARLGSVNRNMQARFGQPAVNMCRATLNETLVNKAWGKKMFALYFEKRLVGIEDRADRPVVAHFADGSTAEGDFVIGADGVHSVLRTHVVPDGPRPFDTGLIGFGGFVPRSVLADTPRSGSASRPPLARAGSSATAFAAPTPMTG